MTKCYGARRAVDDVSFEVGAGEIMGLLGPNGSGKSTLLRCLTGFFSPTSGAVRVQGVDVAERPIAARRHIGYLPEQVAVYPELSVRRYLAFVAGAKGLGGRARQHAVEDALARCNLDDVATRPSGNLSKGYRQRVGLAQALLGDPELLVFDEPTVGLDPVQTVELRELIRGLAGRTIVLSTHLLAEAASLCSRVAILNHGRLVAVDAPADLARQAEARGGIVIRIEGPPADVTAALTGVDGVERVEALAGDGRAGHAFRVRSARIDAVQRALAPTVVGHGWALLEMRVEEPTLEELFVRLVGG